MLCAIVTHRAVAERGISSSFFVVGGRTHNLTHTYLPSSVTHRGTENLISAGSVAPLLLLYYRPTSPASAASPPPAAGRLLCVQVSQRKGAAL